MLKLGQWLFTIVLAAIGIFATYMLVIAMLPSASKIIENNVKDLQAIDVTFMAEKCFGGGVIEEDFLNENKRKNICTLCGICGDIAEVIVKDLETDEEWTFRYGSLPKAWDWLKEKFTFFQSHKHASHMIYVNIEREDGIHMGGLIAEV